MLHFNFSFWKKKQEPIASKPILTKQQRELKSKSPCYYHHHVGTERQANQSGHMFKHSSSNWTLERHAGEYAGTSADVAESYWNCPGRK